MPYKDPEMRKSWRRRNRERAKLHDRKYKQTHKEKIRLDNKLYRETYKEERYKQTKKWIKEHPEQYKIKKQNWYFKNKPEIRVYLRNWRRTHIRKDMFQRRQLGFEVLWKPEIIIEPMEWHHISQNWMVLIPKRVHRSIYHNVWTGRGMREINDLAFKYIAFNCSVFAIVSVSMVKVGQSL